MKSLPGTRRDSCWSRRGKAAPFSTALSSVSLRCHEHPGFLCVSEGSCGFAQALPILVPGSAEGFECRVHDELG